MHRQLKTITIIAACAVMAVNATAAPSEKKVMAVMKEAASFMMDEVSTNGGFVWNYTADLSERWGEVPARPSQIWVQGATNGVGQLFLDIYDATGDELFLEYARRVGDAIVWGQYPSGGWHYLIDFDMTGIRTWYDEVASKCWGWEEYYHYYGNCTFDDDSTGSSIRFLQRLYMTTLDPVYREPLLKGLDFVLEAQFPNGAWPQRYPLSFEYPKDGRPDYTSFYTFNDGVIPILIDLLVSAWEELGDERYWDAARRGMDFYLISQGPREQAGWAEQYDWDMQPAQARSYEPAAYKIGTTLNNVNYLMKFYKLTGDRRYLSPIPLALEWVDNSKINDDPAKTHRRAYTGGRYSDPIPYTHAKYYEPGTNKPLFVRREGTSIENGKYVISYEMRDLMCHLGMASSTDTTPYWEEYRRVSALSPEEAHAEYVAPKNAPERAPSVDTARVEDIISSLDGRGAWLTDIDISNYDDPCSLEGRRPIHGISTRKFQANMNTLLDYLKSR